MINSKTPHDDFFKLVFSKKEVVADFLTYFLDIKDIDTASLSLLPTEKKNKYKKFFLDLAFKTKYKNKNAQIYIVFEHKSYPDKMVYFQILSYAMSIWQEEKENLTPIIPIIFYHGKQKFELKDNFNELFSIQTPYNLNLPFKTFNINKIDDEKLLTCQNLFLCASIFTMKHIFDNINELKKLSHFYSKISKDNYFLIVEYISAFKNEEEEEILEKITPKEDKVTILEKYKKIGFDEGINLGLEQGVQKGREEGIIKGKVLAFYELGIKKEDIAKKLNLTIQQIEKILKEK